MPQRKSMVSGEKPSNITVTTFVLCYAVILPYNVASSQEKTREITSRVCAFCVECNRICRGRFSVFWVVDSSGRCPFGMTGGIRNPCHSERSEESVFHVGSPYRSSASGNTLSRGEGGFLRSKKTGEERRKVIYGGKFGSAYWVKALCPHSSSVTPSACHLPPGGRYRRHRSLQVGGAIREQGDNRTTMLLGRTHAQ